MLNIDDEEREVVIGVAIHPMPSHWRHKSIQPTYYKHSIEETCTPLLNANWRMKAKNTRKEDIDDISRVSDTNYPTKSTTNEKSLQPEKVTEKKNLSCLWEMKDTPTISSIVESKEDPNIKPHKEKIQTVIEHCTCCKLTPDTESELSKEVRLKEYKKVKHADKKTANPLAKTKKDASMKEIKKNSQPSKDEVHSAHVDGCRCDRCKMQTKKNPTSTTSHSNSNTSMSSTNSWMKLDNKKSLSNRTTVLKNPITPKSISKTNVTESVKAVRENKLISETDVRMPEKKNWARMFGVYGADHHNHNQRDGQRVQSVSEWRCWLFLAIFMIGIYLYRSSLITTLPPCNT